MASGCMSLAGVLALAFGERKKENSLLLITFYVPGILPLTFCRSENESTESLSNMSTVTQLGSGRTRGQVCQSLLTLESETIPDPVS